MNYHHKISRFLSNCKATPFLSEHLKLTFEKLLAVFAPLTAIGNDNILTFIKHDYRFLGNRRYSLLSLSVTIMGATTARTLFR